MEQLLTKQTMNKEKITVADIVGVIIFFPIILIYWVGMAILLITYRVNWARSEANRRMKEQNEADKITNKAGQ